MPVLRQELRTPECPAPCLSARIPQADFKQSLHGEPSQPANQKASWLAGSGGPEFEIETLRGGGATCWFLPDVSGLLKTVAFLAAQVGEPAEGLRGSPPARASDTMFEDELILLNQSINEFGDNFRNGLSGNPSQILGLRDAFKDSLRALSEKLSLKLKEEEKMVETFLEYQNQLRKQNKLIEEKKDNLLKMIGEVKNKKQELEGLTANIQDLKEEYCRKKETISTANKANGERLKRLQISADMYKDHLELEIRKIHGDKLQFIFTGIDPKKPERPYMFSLCLNEARDYEVSDCSPPLECLAEFQEKVRKTNNFSAFLANVRKAFIATVHN